MVGVRQDGSCGWPRHLPVGSHAAQSGTPAEIKGNCSLSNPAHGASVPDREIEVSAHGLGLYRIVPDPPMFLAGSSENSGLQIVEGRARDEVPACRSLAGDPVWRREESQLPEPLPDLLR